VKRNVSRTPPYIAQIREIYEWYKKVEMGLTFHDWRLRWTFYLDPKCWSRTMARCMVTHGREPFPQPTGPYHAWSSRGDRRVRIRRRSDAT